MLIDGNKGMPIYDFNDASKASGYSIGDLKGLFGIDQTKGLTVYETYYDFYPKLDLDTYTDEITNLRRQINFADLTIVNHTIEVRNQHKNSDLHIGSNVFFLQVATAKRLQFDRFETHAQGDHQNQATNGYIFWGKKGYTMKPDFKLKFDAFMRHHGRTELDLYHLLLTQSGELFWKNNGFDWEGEFSLHPSSINMQYLNHNRSKYHLPPL